MNGSIVDQRTGTFSGEASRQRLEASSSGRDWKLLLQAEIGSFFSRQRLEDSSPGRDWKLLLQAEIGSFFSRQGLEDVDLGTSEWGCY